MSTITILIGKIAAPLKQRRVKKGTTLSNFLLMLSLPKDKYDDVKINGNKLPLNTELNDRDIVTIISNVSGAATVKRFGGPWRVHLNDSDKIFPSNFHAHNLQTNEQMDLYTGLIYRSTSKQPVRKESKKKLLEFLRDLKSRKNMIISSKANIVIHLLNQQSRNRLTSRSS